MEGQRETGRRDEGCEGVECVCVEDDHFSRDWHRSRSNSLEKKSANT